MAKDFSEFEKYVLSGRFKQDYFEYRAAFRKKRNGVPYSVPCDTGSRGVDTTPSQDELMTLFMIQKYHEMVVL